MQLRCMIPLQKCVEDEAEPIFAPSGWFSDLGVAFSFLLTSTIVCTFD
jgi:hypothetical protein